MSVLIKGMEMPKPNTMFTVTLRDRQDRTAEFISMSGETVKSFPMIEVPTPHGRLIDADKLEYELCEFGHYKVDKAEIDSSETVIEAEVSE